jgi:hypothetical protein
MVSSSFRRDILVFVASAAEIFEESTAFGSFQHYFYATTFFAHRVTVTINTTIIVSPVTTMVIILEEEKLRQRSQWSNKIH